MTDPRQYVQEYGGKLQQAQQGLPSDWTEEDEAGEQGNGPPRSWLR